MKKVIFFIFALFLLAACGKKEIHGFVVAKVWIKGHMDNERGKEVEEASIIVPVVPPPNCHYFLFHHRKPEYVPSKFTLFVANKRRVHDVDVDSLTYIKTKVGQRITIKK
ncbi:membrane lipoprotein lipid attachment site-containing protein [Prevotella falsenii]|uniref:membrane lipoprotein lipid attachment site-containing protein n=1 Tax=Prevotella falsenii TaxID=515414 RepID=UPI000469AC99|nr:membrane lipoprotein lipid attachment site-containing protein [Prevotella falsenii]